MDKVLNRLNDVVRKLFLVPRYRQRLKKHDVTILCNNCVGGCIAHDLDLRFNSPFVNLWLTPQDFIKYCSDIQHYMQSELAFIKSDLPYPVALLDDITIYFMHYASEAEAREKWESRTQRMRLDHLCGILVVFGNCTEEDIGRFQALPFPTASLVHQPSRQEGAHLISGFEGETELGNIVEFKKHCLGRKYYDDFDFVRLINEA